MNFDTAKYFHFNAGGSRPKAKDRTPPTCADIGNVESEDIYVRLIHYSIIIEHRLIALFFTNLTI